MSLSPPRLLEVYGTFRIPLGPRSESAGLRLQFHDDQSPGVHFKVEPPEEYRAAILRGIQEGMALRFPDFLRAGSISVIEVTSDEVASSERAFYRAARFVIDQAFSLAQTR